MHQALDDTPLVAERPFIPTVQVSHQPRSSSKSPIILISEYLMNKMRPCLDWRRVLSGVWRWIFGQRVWRARYWTTIPREAMWRVRNLGKSTLTFTTFHQRCVVKLAILVEVRLPSSCPFCKAHPCAHMSVLHPLPVERRFHFYWITSACLMSYTGILLRHDVALETDAVAVGKCGPNQRLSECLTEDGYRCSMTALSSLHIFALVRNTLLLEQLLAFTARLPTTNMIFNKTQLWRPYGQVRCGKPEWHRNCLPQS